MFKIFKKGGFVAGDACGPPDPCPYCLSDWRREVWGYSHSCRPPEVRHVTLADSLREHRARLHDQRPKRRASKPKVRLGGAMPRALESGNVR